MTAQDQVLEDRKRIAVEGGALPISVFRPAADTPLPLVVFCPGGGFTERYQVQYGLCRLLAGVCAAVVVCVDYRLAPAHPFPAAPEDCYGALRWAHAHAGEMGADPKALVAAGESAGGALASVICLMARDRAGPAVASQVLACPFVGGETETPSRRDFGPVDHLVAAWRAYTPKPGDAAHPYASPLNADLRGLPPALVLTGADDPLRDEGETFADRLRAHGNEVGCFRLEHAEHGFLSSIKAVRARAKALRLIAADFDRRFGGQRAAAL